MGVRADFHILEALQAEVPNPDYTEQLRLFGQFIGVWDMTVKFYAEDGHLSFDGSGEWAFSWILDGRAIQDVLSYFDAETHERRTGTTLRYYHPQKDLWQCLWLGAVSGIFLPLESRPHGADIWLEGKEAENLYNRWMFTEITENSFHWIGLISSDEGVTWRMEQEMSAQRRLIT